MKHVSHLRGLANSILITAQMDLYENLRVQAEEIRKMLNGYIDWLKEKKIGEKEPGANLHIREEPAEYFASPADGL